MYIWILIGIISLIAELASPGLFIFLSCSLSAFLIAITTHLIYLDTRFLIALFLAMGTAFLLLIKSLSHLSQSTIRRSNIDAAVGKKALVIKELSSSKRGIVKLYGDLWTAETNQENTIPKGSWVIVTSITSNIVHVSTIQ